MPTCFRYRIKAKAFSMAGVRPQIRIYETSENAEQVRHLHMLRRQLVVLAVVALLLLATLAVQLALA